MTKKTKMLHEIELIIGKMEFRHPHLYAIRPEMKKAITLIIDCFKNGNKLLVCGNGGSASDAMHIVAELGKDFKLHRPIPTIMQHNFSSMFFANDEHLFFSKLQIGLPAISLCSEPALMTAILNDMDGDVLFAQQVFSLGKQGDVLLALSTSGQSKNVLNACKVAKYLGMGVIGMTGSSPMKFCDIALRAPAEKASEVQEFHSAMYHAICEAVEVVMFKEDA